MKRVIVGLLLLASVAFAIDEEPMALWPAGHVALDGVETNNVPELTVYRPLPGVKGASVILIICPGGGYSSLTMVDEGHSVAQWYAKHGVTGVVLKYRLPKKGKWGPQKEFSTLRDAQRAVQLMRYTCKDLGVPDAKIGILGFSAGGHLACMTATRWREGDTASEDPVEKLSSRPDFACLIYPVISFMGHGHGGSRNNLLGKDSSLMDRKTYSGEFNVSSNTPPIFMVHANNDGVKPENSVIFYQALREQQRPVEMHIVSRGNHGFYDFKGWGIPRNAELRFTRAGSMWPVWTLNWLLEEDLVSTPDTWEWSSRQKQLRKVIDP